MTANPGLVESTESVAQPVNVISERQIDERAKSVTAQVAGEEVGVHIQRTSPTIAGIFVRGLTGNKVNVFVDGVRYSTAAMRGGINSFLNLIDQTNLQAVEILRGPNSAQYGSDAIGGSVQFLTLAPSFSSDGPVLRGKLGTYFNSADAGFGSNLAASYSARNFGLVTNFAGRRVNTLRTGGGIDSHNAVTRFLGLGSRLVVGDRMPDTAFTQYGGLIKMNWAPAEGHQLIMSYARSQQDGGKRFDQLIGGDGNLVADVRNFMLDFAYVRYDRARLGWFDNFTAVYSFNSQREERVNQGGNGNPRASINHELERTNANGFQTFVSKRWGARQNLLLGAEYYHEWVDAPSFGFNPVTGLSSPRRGRVPHHATFDSGGVYTQDVVEVIPDKLRLIGNVRWSAAKYKAREREGLLVASRILFPDDSLRVDDVTFRAGAVVTPVEGLSLSANISRGSVRRT
ncbi:MAG: TonB-dependent receptor [Blastocatellia bacterium]